MKSGGATSAHGSVLQEVEQRVCRLCYPHTRGLSCVCEREGMTEAHLLSDCYYYKYYCSSWGLSLGATHSSCLYTHVHRQTNILHDDTTTAATTAKSCAGGGTQMQQRYTQYSSAFIASPLCCVAAAAAAAAAICELYNATQVSTQAEQHTLYNGGNQKTKHVYIARHAHV
jgi:hypothetical protein